MRSGMFVSKQRVFLSAVQLSASLANIYIRFLPSFSVPVTSVQWCCAPRTSFNENRNVVPSALLSLDCVCCRLLWNAPISVYEWTAEAMERLKYIKQNSVADSVQTVNVAMQAILIGPEMANLNGANNQMFARKDDVKRTKRRKFKATTTFDPNRIESPANR